MQNSDSNTFISFPTLQLNYHYLLCPPLSPPFLSFFRNSAMPSLSFSLYLTSLLSLKTRPGIIFYCWNTFTIVPLVLRKESSECTSVSLKNETRLFISCSISGLRSPALIPVEWNSAWLPHNLSSEKVNSGEYPERRLGTSVSLKGLATGLVIQRAFPHALPSHEFVYLSVTLVNMYTCCTSCICIYF